MKNVFADLNIHLTLTGSIEGHPAAAAVFVYLYPVDEPAQQTAGGPDVPVAETVVASAPSTPEFVSPEADRELSLSLLGLTPSGEAAAKTPAGPEPELPHPEPPSSKPDLTGPRGGIRKTCPICGIPISMYAKACAQHAHSGRSKKGAIEPTSPPDAARPPASLRLRDRDPLGDYGDAGLDLSDLHGSRIA